jgi:hypothetical protein
VTYHAKAIGNHDTNISDCESCHDGSWVVLDTYCDGCHLPYRASDTVPPVTTSNVRAAYLGAARVDFIARDSGMIGVITTRYRVNGGPVVTGDVFVSSKAAGTYVLEFWSVDQNGNEETPHKSATFTVTADTTPPVTTSNARSVYEGPAIITLTPTDAGTSGVRATYYTVNGGPRMTGTTVTVPEPVSGATSNALTFWSEDYSGNVETPKTATFTVSRDSTPPSTTTDARLFYTSRFVLINLTSTDSGSGVQMMYCRLDGGPTLQTMTYFLHQHMTQGAHVLEYWAVDRVGNVEPHKFANFVVDWTAPTVSSNAVSAYPATGASITITGSDLPSNGAGLANVVYMLDGAAAQYVASPTTLSVTAPGVHTLEYWAIDRAGIASERTAVVFTVGNVVIPNEGRIELRWGDGSLPDWSAWASFVIRNSAGVVVASGDSVTYRDAFGSWTGTFRATVPVSSQPYYWSVDWSDRWDGGTSEGWCNVSAPGQVAVGWY